MRKFEISHVKITHTHGMIWLGITPLPDKEVFSDYYIDSTIGKRGCSKNCPHIMKNPLIFIAWLIWKANLNHKVERSRLYFHQVQKAQCTKMFWSDLYKFCIICSGLSLLTLLSLLVQSVIFLAVIADKSCAVVHEVMHCSDHLLMLLS